MTASVLILATLVRNPFWPIDYDGPFERISAEARIAVATAENEHEAEADTTTSAVVAAREEARTALGVQSRKWMDARKRLRISGTATALDAGGREKQSVIINGYTYGSGDLISVNHDGHRFTWRIEGFVPGEALRLVRVKVRQLEDDEETTLKGTLK